MKNYKDVEHSLITKYRKDIWRKFMKAVRDYDLIKENDHIAVCISGGKDSVLLAKCLEELQKHGDISFKLSYIVMNPGYKKETLEIINKNLESLNISYHLFVSNIFEVANKLDKDHPCYMCARMRRGFLYKKGQTFTAAQVLALARKTRELVGDDIFLSVTIPGELEISEQIKLARDLETLGVDLIQTEGHFSNEAPSNGVKGLLERAELTISNTIELTRNIDIPVMTATGINPTTAALAFAAGASAIGCGSCVNKLDSEISMLAVSKSLVEIAERNAQYIVELV